MAARAKLTPDRVKGKKKPGLYGDGGGLYLRVSTATARSWVFRYAQGWKTSANGKRYPDGREMGLGSYPEIDLPAARDLAEHWRRVKAEGMDPIEVRASARAAERVQAAKAITFRQCAESYIAAHKEGWKNSKHAAQWGATLETYAMPTIGDVPVGAVDRALVIAILEPIWKTKTETARRLRGRIEAVLDWASAREYRGGDNPARWKGSLEKLFPAHAKVRRVKHHPALAYGDLPAFMSKLRAEEGLGSQALQLTILTATRTGEAIGGKWPEVDFDKAVWTVPPERTKTGREHRIPLSRQAVTLRRQGLHLPRRAAQEAPFQHGDAENIGAHGARRHHRARVSLDVPRLGRGNDQFRGHGL
jgi:integrase